MTKTPEEKAREYAEITPDVKNVNNLPEIFSLNKIKYQTYLDSYHSRDEELAAYREALKELTDQIYKCPLDLSSDEKVEEATYLDATIKQSKQLLNDE